MHSQDCRDRTSWVSLPLPEDSFKHQYDREKEEKELARKQEFEAKRQAHNDRIMAGGLFEPDDPLPAGQDDDDEVDSRMVLTIATRCGCAIGISGSEFRRRASAANSPLLPYVNHLVYDNIQMDGGMLVLLFRNSIKVRQSVEQEKLNIMVWSPRSSIQESLPSGCGTVCWIGHSVGETIYKAMGKERITILTEN